MAEWELRPLSLGEILDRTFTLYRRNFLLFLGITAIPRLLSLGLNLAQVAMNKLPYIPTPPTHQHFQAAKVNAAFGAFGVAGGLFVLFIYLVIYLFSQGGTIYAVSDLYLGRTATIGGSLKSMWGQLANLFGVVVLNGLATVGATFLLIIPGIYVACRLIACLPAALLEDLGARASLERSWHLTRDNAGRSFVIYVLYFAILYGISMVLVAPFGVMMAMSAKDPTMMRTSLILIQIGSFAAEVLVTPFLLIATSVFYYDLRVKKEAFDLQMMMDPTSVASVPGSATVPTMFG